MKRCRRLADFHQLRTRLAISLWSGFEFGADISCAWTSESSALAGTQDIGSKQLRCGLGVPSTGLLSLVFWVHHVDEVPVPGRRFEGEMVVAAEMPARRAQPHHQQHALVLKSRRYAKQLAQIYDTLNIVTHMHGASEKSR